MTSLLLSLIIGIAIGWFSREIYTRTKAIETYLLEKRRKDENAPISSILEPELTAAERAIRDQQELIESINRGA